jgi:hypothetical protein
MNQENKIPTEKCISCGKDTGIPVNKDIDYRTTYIEGSGQLCSDCFKKIYNEVHKKNDDVSG